MTDYVPANAAYIAARTKLDEYAEECAHAVAGDFVDDLYKAYGIHVVDQGGKAPGFAQWLIQMQYAEQAMRHIRSASWYRVQFDLYISIRFSHEYRTGVAWAASEVLDRIENDTNEPIDGLNIVFEQKTNAIRFERCN